MTIKPKNSCKICSSTGRMMFWNSRHQGTYHQGDKISKNPCMCLMYKYHKLGNPTEPKFDEVNGQTVIILDENIENIENNEEFDNDKD